MSWWSNSLTMRHSPWTTLASTSSWSKTAMRRSWSQAFLACSMRESTRAWGCSTLICMTLSCWLRWETLGPVIFMIGVTTISRVSGAVESQSLRWSGKSLTLRFCRIRSLKTASNRMCLSEMHRFRAFRNSSTSKASRPKWLRYSPFISTAFSERISSLSIRSNSQMLQPLLSSQLSMTLTKRDLREHLSTFLDFCRQRRYSSQST